MHFASQKNFSARQDSARDMDVRGAAIIGREKATRIHIQDKKGYSILALPAILVANYLP